MGIPNPTEGAGVQQDILTANTEALPDTEGTRGKHNISNLRMNFFTDRLLIAGLHPDLAITENLHPKSTKSALVTLLVTQENLRDARSAVQGHRLPRVMDLVVVAAQNQEASQGRKADNCVL